MTVGKAITIRRRNGGPSSRLIQTFLREGRSGIVKTQSLRLTDLLAGVFYYILISVANLVNGIFYLQ